MNGKPIITGDASHPEVSPLSAVPQAKERRSDLDLYRSYASIPIGPLLEGETTPYGVLVATSDRVGRFDKENTLALVHMADLIASNIALLDLRIDRLQQTSDEAPTVPGR